MYVISYKVMEGDNHVVTNCFTGITIYLSTNCSYCCRFFIYWPYVRVIYRFTGLPLGYPLIMCLLIFAGSMEFITVTLLFQPFDPVGAFIMALMVNGRHLFYAITMLGKYRGKGWKTPYLIYGMCDESFAVNVTTEVPENIDEGWFYFWVTLLNQAYWFMGVLIGSIAGSTLTFLPLKGIGFVLTAMFVVLFLDLCRSKSAKCGIMGLAITLVALFICGPASFLIPAMAGILFVFLLRYRIGGIAHDD